MEYIKFVIHEKNLEKKSNKQNKNMSKINEPKINDECLKKSSLSLDDALQLSSYPKYLLDFIKQFLIDNYSDNDNATVYLYKDNENIFLVEYKLKIELNQTFYNVFILVYFPILFPNYDPQIYIKKTTNLGLNKFYDNKIDFKDFRIKLEHFLKFDPITKNIREIIDNLVINFTNEFPVYRENIKEKDKWIYSGKCVLCKNKITKVIIPKKQKNIPYINYNKKNYLMNDNLKDNSLIINDISSKINPKEDINEIIEYNNQPENNLNDNDNDFSKILINFEYNCNRLEIQCNLKEKMKDIINQFITKSSANKNSIYFLYGGAVIKEESLLSEIISNVDKSRKQMNILVNSVNQDPNEDENNSIIKSKEIICPKCSEHINLLIKNYTISLFDCKNGHEINDIKFNDFIKTQNIDLKKIKCDLCKERNKYNSYNHEFYQCFTCNKNLCPICKSIHDNSHKIRNCDESNSICTTHFESFNSYCKNCKKNLCIKCEKNHAQHEKIYYGSILSDPDEIKSRIKELETNINQLNENLDDIINRMKIFKENINSYYKISIDVMKNVDNNNRNYEILNNIIKICDNDIMRDIKKIVEEKELKKKVDIILNIIDNWDFKSQEEIKLINQRNNNNNNKVII